MTAVRRPEKRPELPQRFDRRRVAIAFGRVLKALREEAGLSQEAFALLAGLDRTTPSLYERGIRQPTLTYLFMLAEALGTEAEHLVIQTRLRLEGCSRT